MMTTSAVARLIPRPPARVLNMNRNFKLLGSLKALMEIWGDEKNVTDSFICAYLLLSCSVMTEGQFIIMTVKSLQGLKQKQILSLNFFRGLGVAGVDTYTGLFGEQTHKQKTFENDFPWNYQINKLIKQNGTNKVLHMQRTQWLWQL